MFRKFLPNLSIHHWISLVLFSLGFNMLLTGRLISGFRDLQTECTGWMCLTFANAVILNAHFMGFIQNREWRKLGIVSIALLFTLSVWIYYLIMNLTLVVTE